MLFKEIENEMLDPLKERNILVGRKDVFARDVFLFYL